MQKKNGLKCSKVCGHCRGQSCLNAELTNNENNQDVDFNIEISPLDVLSVTINDIESDEIENEWKKNNYILKFIF